MEYEYYVIKIKCGCESDGTLGPYEKEPTQEEMGELHDDPANVDNSLFILKIEKNTKWELY